MSKIEHGVSTRTKRTPVNGRNILTVVGKEPGYHYRIVNDNGDRISQFIEAGYEMVPAKSVKIGDRGIMAATAEGSHAQAAVGLGQKAFVMRIKNEYYEEDQKNKAEYVSKIEESTKRQATNNADFGSITRA